jgi:hypothetical protein
MLFPGADLAPACNRTPARLPPPPRRRRPARPRPAAPLCRHRSPACLPARLRMRWHIESIDSGKAYTCRPPAPCRAQTCSSLLFSPHSPLPVRPNHAGLYLATLCSPASTGCGLAACAPARARRACNLGGYGAAAPAPVGTRGCGVCAAAPAPSCAPHGALLHSGGWPPAARGRIKSCSLAPPLLHSGGSSCTAAAGL